MSQNGTSTTPPPPQKDDETLNKEETQCSEENEDTSRKTITNTEAKESSNDIVAETQEKTDLSSKEEAVDNDAIPTKSETNTKEEIGHDIVEL